MFHELIHEAYLEQSLAYVRGSKNISNLHIYACIYIYIYMNLIQCDVNSYRESSLTYVINN